VVFGLGLALMAVLSCTAGESPLLLEAGDGPATVDGGLLPPDSVAVPVDTGTVTPVDSGAVTPVDTAATAPEDTAAAPSSDAPREKVLVCETQPYASSTVEIGRQGGLITVGNHSLKIPERALSERVTITMEQVQGTANSVRFSPEGLQFEVPAVLTLSYKNCSNVKHWKSIVYTDEMLNILEPTLSLDFSSSSQVRGLIFHFSRYAVAF